MKHGFDKHYQAINAALQAFTPRMFFYYSPKKLIQCIDNQAVPHTENSPNLIERTPHSNSYDDSNRKELT